MTEWHTSLSARQTTTRCEDRDFVEWHQGRKRYSIWALEIDQPQWHAQLAMARLALSRYCLEGLHRQPHITLFASGFVDDDQYQKNIHTQLMQLRAEKLSGFELALGSINSFSSAAYYSIINNDGGLNRLREILQSTQTEDRTEPWVPHLTIGLYNDAHPVEEIQQILSSLPDPDVPMLRVKALSLMQYSTTSIFSPLQTCFRVALGSPST